MKNVNIAGIITATDTIAYKSTTIGGKRHGASWLFDKVMRAFSCDMVEAVTYEVFLNAPIMKPAFATIHRNGDFEISKQRPE